MNSHLEQKNGGRKMKKCILIAIISLVCLLVPSVLVIAKNNNENEKSPLVVVTDFNLEVFREGKLSEKNLLVTLQIWDLGNGNGFSVSWNHVRIEPVHTQKKVYISGQHFSTEEGSIKNVRVHKNGFSFRLDYIGGMGLTADIVGKEEGKLDGIPVYSVKASAMAFSIYRTGSDLQKNPEIWRSTDKKIVLPYKEVF